MVLVVKNLPASTRDIRVQSLAQKDPLEEGTATHSSTPESHGKRSLGAAVRGVTKSQTWLKWLSTAKIKREWQRDQSMWSVCGWGWGDVRKRWTPEVKLYHECIIIFICVTYLMKNAQLWELPVLGVELIEWDKRGPLLFLPFLSLERRCSFSLNRGHGRGMISNTLVLKILQENSASSLQVNIMQLIKNVC